MNPLKSKLVLSLVAFVTLSFGSAISARADIIAVSGNVPQTDENVLLKTGLTGNPIFGITNQTQTSVRFTGQETLTAPANGQARIEAVDGSLNALTIDLSGSTTGAPTGSFTSLILNLNSEEDGTVFFMATDTTGDVFQSQFALDGSGENFFTFTTINDQRIASVSFTTSVPVGLGLDDVRQVRIGGALNNSAPVPEPATMFLLGTGLAGVAAKVRNRRKANNGEAA
jgi:hypothetical protein